MVTPGSDKPRCGWSSDFPTFANAEPRTIRHRLEDFIAERDPAQVEVWDRSIPLLQSQVAEVLARHKPAGRFWALLEYELPREGGRRPDVIVLENGPVLVVEYKSKDGLLAADIDQVASYARDLQQYHAMCHESRVVPILVVAGIGSGRREESGVTIVPPSELAEVLLEEAKRASGPLIDADQWVRAEYSPQLDLLQSARIVFRKERLPRIKRAGSDVVDKVVDRLAHLSIDAKAKSQRHLVLVTGVPGAGKTLVGLKFVYDDRLTVPAVLLSGNQPLVEVLRYALGPGAKAKAFVQLMKPFIRYHGQGKPPPEHVLVFDEAQRAWDRDKVRAKHQDVDLGDFSEPQLLMRIGNSIPDWAVVVGLVGEGQEIFTGEESGIGQWNEAVDSSWIVHGPEHLQSHFKGKRYECDDLLNLTRSLRSHVTSDVHVWGGCLLEGKADSTGADTIWNSGFRIYLTRDFENAKKYARDRFSGKDKRFGLLVSSRARSLFRDLGIERVPTFRLGQWFEVDPASPWSCCTLSTAATEFECQGLELDLPIVCWGEDFRWDGAKWIVPKLRYKDAVRDPFTLRKNTYRVLLSRGRDGLLIYVPPKSSMDDTATYLMRCGARDLKSAHQQVDSGKTPIG